MSTDVAYEQLLAGQWERALLEGSMHFEERSAVHLTLRRIARRLAEAKIASGMTNPGRLRDLADVQELVRVLRLPDDFGEQLNPFVRDKYRELWSSVQSDS